MQAIYLKSAVKNKIHNFKYILLMIALPLLLGFLYGIMYDSIFNSGYENISAQLPHSTLVTLVQSINVLNPISKMQLSVFNGMTFFLVSIFTAQFVKHRKNHFTHRLSAMGFKNTQVFLGEGISYFLCSLFIIISFNIIFMLANHLNITFTLDVLIGFSLLALMQSLFASAYALFALGVFKEEKTFSLYHFLPAFAISFLGGAFFPVEQVANGGIYQWMPTYLINKLYTHLYTMNALDFSLMSKTIITLGIGSFTLILIGLKTFKLEEDFS